MSGFHFKAKEDMPEVLKECSHIWLDISYPNTHNPSSVIKMFRCKKCKVEVKASAIHGS